MSFDLLDEQDGNRSLLARAGKWVTSHEWVVILAVLLIIGGIAFTAELASDVAGGETEAIDTRLILALREDGDHNDPLGPPWVEEMVRDLTSLGGTALLTLIVLVVTIYYVLQGRYREMLVMLTAVLGAFMLSYMLKGIFDRPRPDLIPEGEYVYTASFPSGHALLAASTYLTLGIIVAQLMAQIKLRVFVLLLSTIVIVLVGFSRVYLGVHWPTDVLAGWTIGIVWAMLVWLIFRGLRQEGAVSGKPVDAAGKG
jgi:undecaprenyl-diphosphatase